MTYCSDYVSYYMFAKPCNTPGSLCSTLRNTDIYSTVYQLTDTHIKAIKTEALAVYNLKALRAEV